MSNNDKTKQKLMDSMRKTKVGAKTNTAAPSSSAPIEHQSEKPAAQKPKTVKTKPKQVTRSKPSSDSFSSSGRVWPD